MISSYYQNKIKKYIQLYDLRMYYINPSITKNPITSDTLVHILTIPIEERSMHDHQLVYRNLIKNSQLMEIERAKSLNARLQMVAFLQVIETLPSAQEQNYRIIQKIQIKRQMDQKKKLRVKKEKGLKDEQLANLFQIHIYYICIKKDRYQSILNADEKYIRRNMDKLKKYSLLQNMEYGKLLHLAYHMETCSYKYKDYVYRQGQNSDYIYFVESGEFNLEKTIAQTQEDQKKEKQLRKSQKKNKESQEGKLKSQKRYEVGMQDNPNRLRKSKSRDFNIGIIQGGSGQCFGDQEIINDKKRQYSVRCNTTDNSIIKIHKSFFKNVTNTPTTINWLKNQNQKKFQAKKVMHEKIIQTKNNYKKYAKMMEKSEKLNKTQKIRNTQEENNSSLDMLQSKLKVIEENQSIKANHKQNIPYLKNSQTRQQNYLANQLQDIQRKKTIKASQHSQQEEDNSIFNDTFALTKAKTDNLRKIKKKNPTKSVHQKQRQDSDASVANSILLPSLYKKQSQQKKQSRNTIQALIGHNWSASRPNIELKGMRNKYSGMVDSNFLVKQKQYILERRNYKQIDRQQIFPFQLDEKAKKQIQKHVVVNKKGSRQMRSAVHSKDYMQKLLIDALKKAGYNTQKTSPDKDNRSSYHNHKNWQEQMDIKTNMRVPKQLKEKLKNAVVSSLKNHEDLLQENSFDQYYFAPI